MWTPAIRGSKPPKAIDLRRPPFINQNPDTKNSQTKHTKSQQTCDGTFMWVPMTLISKQSRNPLSYKNSFCASSPSGQPGSLLRNINYSSFSKKTRNTGTQTASFIENTHQLSHLTNSKSYEAVETTILNYPVTHPNRNTHKRQPQATHNSSAIQTAFDICSVSSQQQKPRIIHPRQTNKSETISMNTFRESEVTTSKTNVEPSGTKSDGLCNRKSFNQNSCIADDQISQPSQEILKLAERVPTETLSHDNDSTVTSSISMEASDSQVPSQIKPISMQEVNYPSEANSSHSQNSTDDFPSDSVSPNKSSFSYSHQSYACPPPLQSSTIQHESLYHQQLEQTYLIKGPGVLDHSYITGNPKNSHIQHDSSIHGYLNPRYLQPEYILRPKVSVRSTKTEHRI